MQQLCGVLIVLLALWGTVAYLKRKGVAIPNISPRTRKRAPLIQQLDWLRLTQQHSIHLLRIADANVIVAVHPQGVTVLKGAEALGVQGEGAR